MLSLKKKYQVLIRFYSCNKNKQCMCIVQRMISRNALEEAEKETHRTVHRGHCGGSRGGLTFFLFTILCVYVFPM